MPSPSLDLALDDAIGAFQADPLVAMAGDWFRVGTSRLGPERLRFDTVIDGRARRAWLSGWDYYRVG